MKKIILVLLLLSLISILIFSCQKEEHRGELFDPYLGNVLAIDISSSVNELINSNILTSSQTHEFLQTITNRKITRFGYVLCYENGVETIKFFHNISEKYYELFSFESKIISFDELLETTKVATKRDNIEMVTLYRGIFVVLYDSIGLYTYMNCEYYYHGGKISYYFRVI